ncbi:TetR/AcrR family transcriptional regulator [Vibrio genomosp. F10 str. 9ZC157]|uniref:TetR family transcriptional regulator n=2 Tax=Vibrio genomosp. F10 TaxID=723171 RepID=A0A1E5BF05_9VIBR|nr:TetR/AcrR family transcriptional regulator [Vibrio genomosp. F10]OEE34282.1 TetR family transcriptional regulator [Vibrio genomosp. F10 str. ZF-129]OEE95733.1 TetR family transcriptional regulator [Vibrio genomosp. F10 str. 9ZC157]
MSNSERKVGRPRQDTESRDKLLASAQELFTLMSYDKVSTRKIADKAGVNIAMIRYYFGNKEGLFEAMLRDALSPMRQQMSKLVKDSTHKNLIDLMRTYYQVMIKTPKLPRLIVQVMNMPANDSQRQLVEKVFLDITQPMQVIIFDKLLSSGVIRSEMDAKLCRFSYISLMVFPFLAPPAMLRLHGVELNADFLSQLFEHNIKLITQGFLTPDVI